MKRPRLDKFDWGVVALSVAFILNVPAATAAVGGLLWPALTPWPITLSWIGNVACAVVVTVTLIAANRINRTASRVLADAEALRAEAEVEVARLQDIARRMNEDQAFVDFVMVMARPARPE